MRLLCLGLGCLAAADAVKISPKISAARERLLAHGHAVPVAEVMEWEAYKAAFVKLYSKPAEEAVAKRAFDENVAEITKLNAQADAVRSRLDCATIPPG